MEFCDSELLFFERIMSKAPEYKPRKSGVIINGTEEELANLFKDEELDAMMHRMTAYNIPKRIRVEIVGITDVYSFKDKAHEERFERIIEERTKKGKLSRRFTASVFLLSSDEILWNDIKKYVSNDSIDFEDLIISDPFDDRLILLKAARDIYSGTMKVLASYKLASPDYVSDEAFKVILIGYLYSCGAIKLKRREQK